MRKIVSYDLAIEKTIEILTNQLQWAASTIAAIYKDRWQIELFFKAIKQNLKIKRFYGTSKKCSTHPDLDRAHFLSTVLYPQIHDKGNKNIYLFCLCFPDRCHSMLVSVWLVFGKPTANKSNGEKFWSAGAYMKIILDTSDVTYIMKGSQ